MPPDEFQKGITAPISANRDLGRSFAGDCVIQRHGFRLGDDQDILTAADLDTIIRQQIKSLEAASCAVVPEKSNSGFLECLVATPKAGGTTFKWTQGLYREYWHPQPILCLDLDCVAPTLELTKLSRLVSSWRKETLSTRGCSTAA